MKSDDVVIDLPDGSRSSTHDNVVLLLPGSRGPGPTDDQPMVVRLQEALDASNEMILVVEPSGRVLFANRAAQAQLGLSDDDPNFRAVEGLLTGPSRLEVWNALEDTGEWRGDTSSTRPDGSTVQLELALLADNPGVVPNRTRADNSDIATLTVIANDVGERRALEDALEHRANHDALTGLSNRQYLLSQLNDELEELSSRGVPSALLLIDIDEFRTVTNSLGHETGDRVLVAFAYRLLRTFPSNALLARVGGDEFGVFCPGTDDVEALAEQVQRTTKAPFFIDGSEVHLSVVTGIAVTNAGEPTPSAEALLRKADAAAFSAKDRGRGSFELFEPHLETDAVDRLSVVQELRRALRNDELRVQYQPKIALSTGEIIGAEALMRWQAPDGELRPPAGFMQVAEDTELIIPMGRWMLKNVCRDAKTLQQFAPEDGHFEISINLSVRQLGDPSLVGDVEDALVDAGLDASAIELEITESALMEDVDANASLLSSLQRLGTSIAVDDFGTGYSSLQYLQQLPVDVLKVDRSFVSGIEEADGDEAIVTAIVQLADALGLSVVAEGVETPGQLDKLRGLGCTLAQGFHFAKPMTIEDLESLLLQKPRW
ncbi:MAG: putative bifunctional diguanylate cyclase/phosphodiesterase [Acidimicrobiales bacterium]